MEIYVEKSMEKKKTLLQKLNWIHSRNLHAPWISSQVFTSHCLDSSLKFTIQELVKKRQSRYAAVIRRFLLDKFYFRSLVYKERETCFEKKIFDLYIKDTDELTSFMMSQKKI